DIRDHEVEFSALCLLQGLTAVRGLFHLVARAGQSDTDHLPHCRRVIYCKNFRHSRAYLSPMDQNSRHSDSLFDSAGGPLAPPSAPLARALRATSAPAPAPALSAHGRLPLRRSTRGEFRVLAADPAAGAAKFRAPSIISLTR